jgi:glycosyltransferase involved in cell wall biosynthesis
MGDWPRISVVTPCLNQVAFIEQTIRSVLDQRYPNLEYIVIDGGSTDGTVEVVQRYADRLALFVSEPDDGQAEAINKGFAQATGDVLAYINSDDFYLPGALHRVAEEYRRDPFDILVGSCRHVDEQGNRLAVVRGRVECIRDLLDYGTYRFSHLTQPEVFWSRQTAEAVGTFNNDLHWVFDYEYWLRSALLQLTFRSIEPELACFRRHSAQKTLGGEVETRELVETIQRFTRRTALGLADRARIYASCRQLRAESILRGLHDARTSGNAVRIAGVLVRSGSVWPPSLVRRAQESQIIRELLYRWTTGRGRG